MEAPQKITKVTLEDQEIESNIMEAVEKKDGELLQTECWPITKCCPETGWWRSSSE